MKISVFADVNALCTYYQCPVHCYSALRKANAHIAEGSNVDVETILVSARARPRGSRIVAASK